MVLPLLQFLCILRRYPSHFQIRWRSPHDSRHQHLGGSRSGRIPGPSGVIRGFPKGQAPHRPIVHPSSCGRFEVRTTARPLHHQGPRRRLRPDYSLVGVGRVLRPIPGTCFSTRDCEVRGETESSHAPYRLFDSQSGLTESRRSRFPRVTSSLPKPAWRRTISSMLTVFPSQSGVPDRVPTFA